MTPTILKKPQETLDGDHAHSINISRIPAIPKVIVARTFLKSRLSTSVAAVQLFARVWRALQPPPRSQFGQQPKETWGLRISPFRCILYLHV